MTFEWTHVNAVRGNALLIASQNSNEYDSLTRIRPSFHQNHCAVETKFSRHKSYSIRSVWADLVRIFRQTTEYVNELVYNKQFTGKDSLN